MTTPLSIQKETAMNSEVAHTPEDAGTGELTPGQRFHAVHAKHFRPNGWVEQYPSWDDYDAAGQAAWELMASDFLQSGAASPPPPASMGEGELAELNEFILVVGLRNKLIRQEGRTLRIETLRKLRDAALRPPLLPDREAVARIILGKTSAFNGEGYDRLGDWAQYPHVANSLTKADDILALLGGVHAE